MQYLGYTYNKHSCSSEIQIQLGTLHFYFLNMTMWVIGILFPGGYWLSDSMFSFNLILPSGSSVVGKYEKCIMKVYTYDRALRYLNEPVPCI